MSSTALILFAVITNVSAQLLLKRGTLELGKVNLTASLLPDLFFRAIQNIWLITGLVSFGLSFAVWILILSKIQLNIAYPIITALNFSFITVSSVFLFKENISQLQIIGIAIILLGIFLVYPK